MYKQAAFIGLRIPTVKGLLSVEQAITLKFTEIATSLKNLKATMNKSDESGLDFLEENKPVDVVTELSFNILKDIYLTKKEENASIRNAAEIKAHNQKIDQLIAAKTEENLSKYSVEELEKLRK